MARTNIIPIFGAGLVLLGLLGFVSPIIWTEQTKDVAKVGDLKLQTTETTPHIVPPLLSGGAVALGVILIGFGLYQRQ